MSSVAVRLLRLLLLLQRQPNQKAAQLAGELRVSLRTLHRYFGMLEEMGIPIYAERGPHGGFSLLRGYRMPPLIFSPEEAVAVCLGTSLVEEMWGELYREASVGAQSKIENVLPEEQLQEVGWARRSLLATGMHRADFTSLGSTLSQLRNAIREHQRVVITYLGGSRPESTHRHIDPYALVHRWGWWYVIGRCHLRDAIRTFRVDRIIDLTLHNEKFEIPSDFTIQAYLASEPGGQPSVQVQMRFLPEAAQVANANRSYWESLREQEDGTTIVTFTAPSLEWAASTALAFGPIVKVLDPPELCRLVKQWAAGIRNSYEGSSINGNHGGTLD